jgi:hypothetical protein
MAVFISYLFKTFITAGTFYLYYWLVLRNKGFHSYNRFYLLSAMLASLGAPFLSFGWLPFQIAKNIDVNSFINRVNLSVSNQSAHWLTPDFIMFGISAFVSLFLLFILASKILWIYRVKAKGKNIQMRGFVLIETEIKQAPFSFLNNLFWKQGLSTTDGFGSRILKHELTHIQQKHTYDKLFTQIVCCVFWMNPFYWLMQRELNTIHEFMADAACIEQGNKEELAKMLLYSYDEGRYLSPSHSFFDSSLARRLHMIGLLSGAKHSVLRKILVLPVILSVVAILSANVTAQENTKTNSETIKEKQDQEPITVVGYKLKKQPAQKANNIKPNKEPIPVTGHELNNNQK